MIARARVLAGVALLAWPSLASACPACLGSQRDTDVLKLIGLFMLVPFCVVGAVFFVVRKISRELAAGDTDSPAP